jgi:hypothetical protein
MSRNLPIDTFRKLAAAGEQAGLSLEEKEMISFLRAGATVEELMEAIQSLIKSETPPDKIM